MKKIEAKIVADSLSPQGKRITTFILTYPRIIHAEVMTHRVFGRNSASSRAIPFSKMLQMVEEDPFIPIAWQKDHKGMQGNEYITDETDISLNTAIWLRGRDCAMSNAKLLNHGERAGRDNGVTKQLCNRLLEPFMWHTVLVTATEWGNFFNLRCPSYRGLDGVDHNSKKDWWYYSKLYTGYSADRIPEPDWYSINSSQAEIHIQALAEAIWDAMNESSPKQLKAGEWHVPFGDRIDTRFLIPFVNKDIDVEDSLFNLKTVPVTLKISTARAARLSYMTFDGEIDYEKDIALHDQLLASRHMSPFEHCARAMSDDEYKTFVKGQADLTDSGDIAGFSDDAYGWCDHLRGFISYRHLVEKQ